MSAGGDMYKAILKEIGAEESYMEYLFEESDEDDNDISNNDQKGDGSHDLLGDFARGEISMGEENEYHTSLISSGDENLVFESETEESGIDDPNKLSREVQTSTSTHSDDPNINISSDSLPSWKQMLQVATKKQEQIMGQMISLQQAQKESSPRHRMKRLTMRSDQPSYEETIVLKEIKDNDPKLSSSMVSSNTVQQISTRNAKLQGQWQSQQEKSSKLQDKLNVMQTTYYSQQEQWEKEKQDLFSPTRSPQPKHSPTKIPKWGSPSVTPIKLISATDTFDEKMTQNNPPDDTSSEELELSKALIQELEKQLEASRKVQEAQKDELRDYKDRLAKRDAEHMAFLLRYETEKKSWQDETKENQAQYQQELQSRDDNLNDTRQKLQEQLVINRDLIEKRKDELRQLVPSNQMNMGAEDSQTQIAYIRQLEEENDRLKTDFTRREELQNAQDEIKLQMKTAMEEQTKKTREFQSRIRELEGRHAEELEYWKSEVDSHRKQIELNSTRMENQLEEANARFADLERKHDKEVKEWQMLLDADIAKTVEGNSTFESQENLLVIGAGSTGAESLSPIRKVPQQNDDDSSQNDSENLPNESINMIDNLLHELGEMDIERTAILQEIKSDFDNSRDDKAQGGDKSKTFDVSGQKTDGEAGRKNPEVESPDEEEPPKPMESPTNDSKHEERKSADALDETHESEVLDETLHLLNNLKTMISSQENVNEHETTVLERLEVLSELMQSQDQSRAAKERSMVVFGSQGNAKDTSWDSAIEAAAGPNPWAALVKELQSRCEFLERDRDEVTRITEQILQMERASHKAELEAAVAAVERKASENLHKVQLEYNREMDVFYQNICAQCEDEAFDYAEVKENIDELNGDE